MSVLATFVKKSHLEARDLLLYAFHPKRAPASKAKIKVHILIFFQLLRQTVKLHFFADFRAQCKCTYQKLHKLGKSHSWTYTHNIAHGRKYRRAFVFSPCRTAFGSLDIDFHQIFWMMMRRLELNYLWKFDLIMVWHHWTSIFGRHWDLKSKKKIF